MTPDQQLLFINLSPDRVAKFLVNCLAVGGGFLVGYVLFGVLAWGCDRWLFKKNTGEPLKKVFKLLGGLAVAILVAFIVFGSGGDGGGSGDGKGKEAGSDSPDQKVNPAESPKKDNTAVTQTKADDRPPEQRIRVTILGGDDVREMKFYLVEGDPAAKTLAEAKQAVLAQRADPAKKVALVIQFPAKNAPAREHPAVTLLARWANEEAGMDVSFPAAKK